MKVSFLGLSPKDEMRIRGYLKYIWPRDLSVVDPKENDAQIMIIKSNLLASPRMESLIESNSALKVAVGPEVNGENPIKSIRDGSYPYLALPVTDVFWLKRWLNDLLADQGKQQKTVKKEAAQAQRMEVAETQEVFKQVANGDSVEVSREFMTDVQKLKTGHLEISIAGDTIAYIDRVNDEAYYRKLNGTNNVSTPNDINWKVSQTPLKEVKYRDSEFHKTTTRQSIWELFYYVNDFKLANYDYTTTISLRRWPSPLNRLNRRVVMQLTSLLYKQDLTIKELIMMSGRSEKIVMQYVNALHAAGFAVILSPRKADKLRKKRKDSKPKTEGLSKIFRNLRDRFLS